MCNPVDQKRCGTCVEFCPLSKVCEARFKTDRAGDRRRLEVKPTQNACSMHLECEGKL